MKNEQMSYEEAKREFEQQISKANTGGIHIHVHVHVNPHSNIQELGDAVAEAVNNQLKRIRAQ